MKVISILAGLEESGINATRRLRMNLTRRPGIRPRRSETLPGLGTRRVWQAGSGRTRPAGCTHVQRAGSFPSGAEQQGDGRSSRLCCKILVCHPQISRPTNIRSGLPMRRRTILIGRSLS